MINLLVKDIQLFINANNASLVPAQNLYIEEMPDIPNDSVVIVETNGQAIMPQVAGATRSVIIMARSMSIPNALTIANQIQSYFLKDDTNIVQLTADRWATVELKSTPVRIKIDEKQRVYYGFTAVFTTYLDFN